VRLLADVSQVVDSPQRVHRLEDAKVSFFLAPLAWRYMVIGVAPTRTNLLPWAPSQDWEAAVALLLDACNKLARHELDRVSLFFSLRCVGGGAMPVKACRCYSIWRGNAPCMDAKLSVRLCMMLHASRPGRAAHHASFAMAQIQTSGMESQVLHPTYITHSVTRMHHNDARM
jgi:hypothetical protein